MGLKIKNPSLSISNISAATNADNARKGLEEIKSATESATANANKAATNANEKAQKAETAANNANTQANRAKEQADNPPKMGENGNWWKWDETQKKYVDTGILAKGGILYPTFTIDPDTKELIMYYQDDIAAAVAVVPRAIHFHQVVSVKACPLFRPAA